MTMSAWAGVAGWLLASSLLLVLLAALLDRLAPASTARLGLALERRRSGLRLRAGAIAGFTMPYLEGGSGDMLVLIHGFGGDKDNFTSMARFLTPHYRVLIPDLPGFGDAGRDARAGYTMDEQAKRLLAWLDQIAPGPVHLGGNSMGGFIAARFAALYPERVASLWLLDPAGTAASHSSEIFQQYARSGEMPLLVRRTSDFPTLMRMATHKLPWLPSSVIGALAQRAVADFPLHTAIMRQLAGSPPLTPQPRYATLPALVVWGEQDRILHPDGAASFGQLLPCARIVMMRGIGHLPMMEAPRRTAQDYLAFRSGLAQAGAA